MYKALPCSDYYGNSVTILDIQVTFLQSCAAALVGQSMLIDTKALEAAPITVAASTSMALAMVFVFVLPAAVLIAGAVFVLLRRRR